MMIVKKSWRKVMRFEIREYWGYFLFGIFPIYVERCIKSKNVRI